MCALGNEESLLHPIEIPVNTIIPECIMLEIHTTVQTYSGDSQTPGGGECLANSELVLLIPFCKAKKAYELIVYGKE